jgi:uncharacterized damage-inducible protein DinB
MKITSQIASHIMEVYEGDNWTDVGIADTIKDLTVEEATTVTPASANTIAAILYHLKFYNEVVFQRLNGVAPEINDANGFDWPGLNNENDWQQFKDAVHASFVQLADAAKNFPEERLNEATPNGGSSYYKNLHGICEHAHYHLGQIVLLRKLVRKGN